MQDFSSTVSFSPSFSFYASPDSNLIEAALRAVRETLPVKVNGENEEEFEFETSPLHEESFFHFPKKLSSEEKERDGVTSKNIFYSGWNIDQSPSSPSHSSSESDDLDDLEDLTLTPSKYYCFWKSPARGDIIKTNKSPSSPKRCRIKEFLRRSHSDGAVTTSGEHKRCLLKKLLSRSHSSPVVKGRHETVSYKPTKIREVDRRRKTYLPYRQDLIGVFAGMSRFR